MTTGGITAATTPKPALRPDDVRLAVPEDRAPLADLMELLHDENGLFSLSLKRRDEMLERFYSRKGAIIGVVGAVGNPVAAIFLSITQPGDYTEDWALVEAFSFVAPDHRKSTYARQLIAWAKQMSDTLKLPLCIGILSSQQTEAKVRLYRQVLEEVGSHFIYNKHLAGGSWPKASGGG